MFEPHIVYSKCQSRMNHIRDLIRSTLLQPADQKMLQNEHCVHAELLWFCMLPACLIETQSDYPDNSKAHMAVTKSAQQHASNDYNVMIPTGSAQLPVQNQALHATCIRHTSSSSSAMGAIDLGCRRLLAVSSSCI